jgi:hypothetical protein
MRSLSSFIRHIAGADVEELDLAKRLRRVDRFRHGHVAVHVGHVLDHGLDRVERVGCESGRDPVGDRGNRALFQRPTGTDPANPMSLQTAEPRWGPSTCAESNRQ